MAEEKKPIESKKWTMAVIANGAFIGVSALAYAAGVPAPLVYKTLMDVLLILNGTYLGAQGGQDILGKVFGKKEEAKP